MSDAANSKKDHDLDFESANLRAGSRSRHHAVLRVRVL
jgi:hypothetical protein